MLILHIVSWAIGLVLFILLMTLNQEKFFKIGSMVLRTTYLLIIISGTILCFTTATLSIALIIKIASSFWIFYSYEMLLGTKKRNESLKRLSLWSQLAVSWIIVYTATHML